MATTRELGVQFSVSAMVRGYHAYQSVWEAVVAGTSFREWPLGCKNRKNFSLYGITDQEISTG